jgi:hypothetical protein
MDAGFLEDFWGTVDAAEARLLALTPVRLPPGLRRTNGRRRRSSAT